MLQKFKELLANILALKDIVQRSHRLTLVWDGIDDPQDVRVKVGLAGVWPDGSQ